MSPDSYHEAPDAPPADRITAAAVLRPLVRAWPLLLLGVALGLAGGGALVYVLGTRYEAKSTLLAIMGGKPAGLGEGLASTLLNAAAGGVQATPALLLKLSELDGVMYEVATTPVGEGTRDRVIDRLMPDAEQPVELARAVNAVRDAVDIEADRQTGVVTIKATHQDSALARTLVATTVEMLRSTFRQAARSQAAELRKAQEERVAASRARLRAAESEMAAFLARNRNVALFSEANLTRQSLERDVNVAQSVYMQAVTEMEAARSRELEDTPSVLVLDPMPPRLPQVPERLPLLLTVGALLGFVAAAMVVLVRDALRAGRAAPVPEAAARRFVTAPVADPR